MITPAALKIIREGMHLPLWWLAEQWGIRETSLKRWEKDRDLPDDLAQKLDLLQREFFAKVDALIDQEGSDVQIPRNTSPDHYPVEYHRAVAYHALLHRPGLTITYAEETS